MHWNNDNHDMCTRLLIKCNCDQTLFKYDDSWDMTYTGRIKRSEIYYTSIDRKSETKNRTLFLVPIHLLEDSEIMQCLSIQNKECEDVEGRNVSAWPNSKSKIIMQSHRGQHVIYASCYSDNSWSKWGGNYYIEKHKLVAWWFIAELRGELIAEQTMKYHIV